MDDNKTEVATLRADINNLRDILLELKQDIKNQPYIPRAEVNLMNASTNARIDKIEETYKQSKTILVAWVGVGLSIITAITTIVSLFRKM